ncbi:unnamed protein product [Adineta steineri]|uniref:Cytochrome P450 n=1 Tax=Adineta steineri TaxID=433720 RepID=A0A814KP96_9BILA|nr:unnamed protein product [Adineta steineri]
MVLFTLFIITIFLLLLCYYIKRIYFTLYGSIPGLPPQFLVGNLLETGVIGKNIPINLIFLDLKAKFGDIFQYWLGPTRIIVVSRLEDVQYIYSHRHIYDQGDIFIDKISLVNPYAGLCMKGASFKRHISITSPLFRRNKINTYLDTINDCTDKLLIRWQNSNDNSREIHLNMIEQCQQLLLSIFGYIAFDYDLQTLDDEYNSQKNELTHALHIHLGAAITTIQLPTIIARIYLLNPVYRRARATIDRYLQEMIEQELRETPDMRAERKRTSLIASLVDSLQQDEKLEQTKSEEDKKGLSRVEVIGEMLSLLSAGYSTTSTSVVWFIFFMSKSCNVQKKLKKEISQYDHQRLTIEQLDSLVYLDCIIRELFRFIPPIVGTVRTLINDDQLPSTGVHLNKGDQIFIPFYNLSRDQRYCPGLMDPNQFHPERFLNTTNDNKIDSITFGGGHRQCIGQDFARIELKAICVRLMQHVTFGDGGEKVNAGGYKQTDTILPKHIGVTITFD